MFVVFDLDGTLADDTHRLHWITTPGQPKRWAEFFAACRDDLPRWHVIGIARAMLAAGHVVSIWTGRSDEVRDATQAWLKDYDLHKVPLLMRPSGDHTDDHVLKAQWMASIAKPDLVFEDRQRVVDMWRAHGVTCCQVAEGDF